MTSKTEQMQAKVRILGVFVRFMWYNLDNGTCNTVRSCITVKTKEPFQLRGGFLVTLWRCIIEATEYGRTLGGDKDGEMCSGCGKPVAT